jgi:inward rectifier potassium channel
MKLRLVSINNIYRPNNYVKVMGQNGKLEQDERDTWYSYFHDPYHLLLTIPWTGFVLIVSVGYILINVIFALLYLAGGDCLLGAKPGSFLDAFFFSLQTLASIGYGVISPKTLYAHGIVTVEAITSLLTIAVVTGLAFARFSKPIARVMFSDVAVVMPYNDVPTLTFRAANKRRNRIVAAHITVDLAIDEETKEGESLRRFYELSLLRQRTSSFNLAWTVRHTIDEKSPLYNLTPEMLIQGHATLIVSLVGIDETVAYTLNARQTYSAREVLWNYRFVDMLTIAPDGDRYLDYQHFHSVEPLV